MHDEPGDGMRGHWMKSLWMFLWRSSSAFFVSPRLLDVENRGREVRGWGWGSSIAVHLRKSCAYGITIFDQRPHKRSIEFVIKEKSGGEKGGLQAPNPLIVIHISVIHRTNATPLVSSILPAREEDVSVKRT
ncbi:hypothetical protein KM043_004426 [Ampulex compressa]|nr:hypothetical protein KM043_004426 [Ampulex compressa]